MEYGNSTTGEWEFDYDAFDLNATDAGETISEGSGESESTTKVVDIVSLETTEESTTLLQGNGNG